MLLTNPTVSAALRWQDPKSAFRALPFSLSLKDYFFEPDLWPWLLAGQPLRALPSRIAVDPRTPLVKIVGARLEANGEKLDVEVAIERADAASASMIGICFKGMAGWSRAGRRRRRGHSQPCEGRFFMCPHGGGRHDDAALSRLGGPSEAAQPAVGLRVQRGRSQERHEHVRRRRVGPLVQAARIRCGDRRLPKSESQPHLDAFSYAADDACFVNRAVSECVGLGRVRRGDRPPLRRAGGRNTRPNEGKYRERTAVT